MITIESQGDWRPTKNWMARMLKLDLALIMNQFGKEGVEALRRSTPSSSGETAAAWNYEVKRTGNSWKIKSIYCNLDTKCTFIFIRI